MCTAELVLPFYDYYCGPVEKSRPEFKSQMSSLIAAFLEIWKSGELEFSQRPDGVVGQVDGLETMVSDKGS